MSQYGRPHKQRKRKVLISEDEPDVEFHSVPQAKRQKSKQKHSLKESVKEIDRVQSDTKVDTNVCKYLYCCINF